MTLLEYIQELFIMWGDNPDLWPDDVKQSAREALTATLDAAVAEQESE